MASAKYTECAGNLTCECNQLNVISTVCSSICNPATIQHYTEAMISKCGPAAPSSVMAQSYDQLRQYFQFFDAKSADDDTYEEDDDDDSDCDNGDDSDDGSRWHTTTSHATPSFTSSISLPTMSIIDSMMDHDSNSAEYDYDYEEEDDDDDDCPNGSWGEPGSGFDIRGNPVPIGQEDDDWNDGATDGNGASSGQAQAMYEHEPDTDSEAVAETGKQATAYSGPKVKRQWHYDDDCDDDDEPDWDDCDDDLWLSGAMVSKSEQMSAEDDDAVTIQTAAIPRIRQVAANRIPSWFTSRIKEKKNTTVASPNVKEQQSLNTDSDDELLSSPEDSNSMQHLTTSAPGSTSTFEPEPSSASEVEGIPTSALNNDDQHFTHPADTASSSVPEQPFPTHVCDDNCGSAITPGTTFTLSTSSLLPSTTLNSSTIPSATSVPWSDSESEEDSSSEQQELADGEAPLADLENILRGIDEDEEVLATSSADASSTATASSNVTMSYATMIVSSPATSSPYAIRPAMVASRLTNPLDGPIKAMQSNDEGADWDNGNTDSTDDGYDKYVSKTQPDPTPESRRTQIPGYKQKSDLKDSVMGHGGDSNDENCKSEQEDCMKSKMHGDIKERFHKGRTSEHRSTWELAQMEDRDIVPTVDLEDTTEVKAAQERDPLSLNERLMPDVPGLPAMPNIRENLPSFRGRDDEDTAGDYEYENENELEHETENGLDEPGALPVEDSDPSSTSPAQPFISSPSGELSMNGTNGTAAQYYRAASNAFNKNASIASRNISLSAEIASSATLDLCASTFILMCTSILVGTLF